MKTNDTAPAVLCRWHLTHKEKKHTCHIKTPQAPAARNTEKTQLGELTNGWLLH